MRKPQQQRKTWRICSAEVIQFAGKPPYSRTRESPREIPLKKEKPHSGIENWHNDGNLNVKS